MGSEKAVNGERGFVFGEPLDKKIIEGKIPIVRWGKQLWIVDSDTWGGRGRDFGRV